MDHAQQCHSRRTNRLCKGLLASYPDTYTRYLTERGYARRTIDSYQRVFRALFHGGRCDRRQAVRRFDKAFVAEFIDEHLPRCNCAEPVRRSRPELRAALSHLLVLPNVSAKTVSSSAPADVSESLRKPYEPDPAQTELHIVRFYT